MNASHEEAGRTPESEGRPGSDARTWAMLVHLSALLGGVFSGGLAVFVGPLVIWLLKRGEHPFVDDQGKEALNFNLSVWLICLIAWVAYVVFGVATIGIGLVLGLPFMLLGVLLLVVFWFVVTIVAMIRASDGVAYRYPLALRLIK